MKRLLLILWLLTAAAEAGFQPRPHRMNQGWRRTRRMAPGHGPGTVHTDLLANGQIPDPFYGGSQSDLQWIIRPTGVLLRSTARIGVVRQRAAVFEGVDCYADIRLNGELLHRTNMFRTWKSDVKGLLKSRTTLHVVFHSPVMQGLKTWRPTAAVTANNDLGALGGLSPNKVSVFTRKSGYRYGWDGAALCHLRIVASGRARSVERSPRGGFPRRTRSTGPRKAQMSASSITDGCGRLLSHPDTVERQEHLRQTRRWMPGRIQSKSRSAPLRGWYPNGMGEPYLYDVELVLEKEGGSLTARPSDAAYEPYRPLLRRCGRPRHGSASNQRHPVFCKGSNYVPADTFCPGFRGRKRISCGAPPKPI
ncbi:MAG: glycosyl hydrolase 2 galactose-binding domain-containing protein [Alistipes onderdonkii]